MNLAVITGADGGMGMEITRAVATAGYQVIMACRDPQAAEPKRQLLMRETGNPRIETAPIDLASLASVAAFAEHLLKRERAVGVADEQCRNHGNGTPHYRRRTGTDGECQLCRALPADPQAAAIDGRGEPYCEYGILYVCHRSS